MPHEHPAAPVPASVIAADGPWAAGRRALTAGLLLAATAGEFESLAVATALPRVAADLGGLALYGWAFGAFLLANLVVVAVAGDTIDRRGPFAAFVLGIALFVVGLLVAAFAPAMPVVVAARAIQGAGAGFPSAATYAAAGLCYPESIRPRVLALLSAARVVPALAGPALAGTIAGAAGWRWVFLAVAPLALVAGALAPPTKGLRPREHLIRHRRLIGCAKDVPTRRARLRLGRERSARGFPP